MNSSIQVTFSYKKQFIHVFYSKAKLALCQKLTHVHLFKFILKCTIINAIILEIVPFFQFIEMPCTGKFFLKVHFIENLELYMLDLLHKTSNLFLPAEERAWKFLHFLPQCSYPRSNQQHPGKRSSLKSTECIKY